VSDLIFSLALLGCMLVGLPRNLGTHFVSLSIKIVKVGLR
jgi:hypothetical protein